VTRTRPGTLIVLAVIGTGAGILLQAVLAAISMPKLRPEFTMSITLALVGVAAVLLAVPVRRAVRSHGPRRVRVDPFYATAVVALAKSAALGGALLAGLGLGLVAELLVRSGAPEGESYLRVFAVLGGGVLLTVGGLVAEWFCTVPKDGGDEPGAGPMAPAG
jgi:hypothetical protein